MLTLDRRRSQLLCPPTISKHFVYTVHGFSALWILYPIQLLCLVVNDRACANRSSAYVICHRVPCTWRSEPIRGHAMKTTNQVALWKSQSPLTLLSLSLSLSLNPRPTPPPPLPLQHHVMLRKSYLSNNYFLFIAFTCSVQDGIYALQKSHMRFTPPLSSFPSIAFVTVPMFVSLTMALSRPFKEDRQALPLPMPLSSRRSMVWCHWLCARW